MPGGALHRPLFKPYALYGTVDYIYGWPAWRARNGFTAAQAGLNVVETVGYLGYLGVVGWFAGGCGVGGARWGGVGGGWGGVACLCGFGLSVMTVSKTVLYCFFLFFFLSREGCVVSFRFWGGEGGWRLFGTGGDVGYTRITWDDWETDEERFLLRVERILLRLREYWPQRLLLPPFSLDHPKVSHHPPPFFSITNTDPL